jgi:hypothetical protein
LLLLAEEPQPLLSLFKLQGMLVHLVVQVERQCFEP